MTNKPANAVEEFRRATGAAMRAISERNDLQATFAPGPAMRSFTPQAKPGAVWLHDLKCSITVTFASSSATSSRCGNTDILSWRSQ